MKWSASSDLSFPITAPRTRQVRLAGWLPDALFLFPALVLFTIVVIYPVLSGLIYGFTDWNGVSPTVHFVGFENFARLFTDPLVRTAFLNTFLFTLAATILQNGIALGLALALNHLMAWSRHLATFLRVLFLIPMLLSPLAIGYLGEYIFSPTFGVVNNILALLHLPWTPDWLGDPHLALGSVIAAGIWQYVGYNMIIFLAGLQTVPQDLYESAQVEGASNIQCFRYITLPMIAPATTISLILTLIGGFKVFDLIFAMTNGGPGYATESLIMRVYREGFQAYHFGYSAAISITFCLFIFGISVVLLAILRRREISL